MTGLNFQFIHISVHKQLISREAVDISQVPVRSITLFSKSPLKACAYQAVMLFQRGVQPVWNESRLLFSLSAVCVYLPDVSLMFLQLCLWVSQQRLRGLNWRCQQWRCFSESCGWHSHPHSIKKNKKRWCLKGLTWIYSKAGAKHYMHYMHTPVWETAVMVGSCRLF